MIYSRQDKNNKKRISKEIVNSREFKQIVGKKVADKAKIEQFFDQYIKIIPQDYLKFLSISDLINFTLKKYEFIYSENLVNNFEFPFKISIKQKPDEDWIINAHIVELLIHDMSFIKNSLIELFQQIGYSIRYMISDIYTLSSKDPSLENHQSGENIGEDRFFYALFILDRNEKFNSESISANILDLLNHVNFVTKDFHRMVSMVKTHHENKKIEKFFNWLCADNFIFFSSSNGHENLGLSNDIKYLNKIDPFCLPSTNVNFQVIKSDIMSSINRRENILIIRYRDIIISGIFTRKADNTSAATIPILSEKLTTLIKSYKNLWTPLDIRDFTFAYDLLPLVYRFVVPIEAYVDFSVLLFQARLTIQSKIKIRSFKKNQYFLMIIWPINELSEGFQSRVKKFFTKYNLSVRGEVNRVLSSVVYFFYELNSESVNLNEKEFNHFEYDLLYALLSWEKILYLEAERKFSFEKFLSNRAILRAIIQSSYKENHTPGEALSEIDNILYATANERLIKGDYNNLNGKIILKIFSKIEYNLSFFIPIFSNMDLSVIDVDSYRFVINTEDLILYKFHIECQNNSLKDSETIRRVCEAVDTIMNQKASSEPLNSLILTTRLSIFQIELLKALVSYLLQIKKGYSRVLLKKVLQNSPELSTVIVTKFELIYLELIQASDKHSILYDGIIRRKIKDYPQDKEKITEYISERLFEIENLKIKNIIQAELLKTLNTVIQSIVRTNYFTDAETISFKIQSDKIDFMSQPRPLYEIWVYHAHFEGVHLRGGVISRGGIRWSDRQDDFRTEIWGLWRTQVLKNTIIVPTGAKGGFVLKYIPNNVENAILMYKKFIRSLIFLTDNRIQNKIKKGNTPLILDNEDSYLVVAADKGTASFSDYANEISLESEFWLGDAFASGGKDGYSHKSLGITALGAWESAKWHLSRKNKDILKNEISVIGIGDMSGDVFGNGMIYSKNIKLIGAFNHKNIFIDPEPDLQQSFQERLRLFNINGDWSKYDVLKISRGGGVYDRDTVSIKLNPKLKAILGTNVDQVSGEEMIRLMLKASVDMIFNGGIGTYIKSSHETSLDIDDMSNDNVRVNADEVKASMIIEGGNLGISPLGRIEYSMRGGIINTDAIDNSAGVDLSDHEVNLKILFKIFMDHGLINTLEDRNKRLKKHASEIVELVLRNNFRQNWALIYLQNLPLNDLECIIDFIELLKAENLWSENSENLRDKNIILDCIKNNKAIPNPILAVIHGLSKIYLRKIFTVNKTIDLYNDELDKYFPASLHKFKYLYLKHPLRDDIIKMMVVNRVMDLMGFPGIVKCLKFLNLNVNQAIQYYFISQKILGVENLKLLRHLPNLRLKKIPENSYDLMLTVKKRIEKAIYRLMEMAVVFNIDLSLDANHQMLPMINENCLNIIKNKNIEEGLSREEALEFFQIVNVEIRFAIAYLIKKKTKPDYMDILDLYYNNGLILLKKELYRIKSKNQWEIQSQIGLKKIFWAGLINCDSGKVRQMIVKMSLTDELIKLRKDNNISLSSLDGIIGYLFS